MKRLFLLLIFFSNFNCGLNKIGGEFYNGEYSIKKHPPNTIQIDHNLFVDQHEILNIDYLEFMYWTERVHGKNSKSYKEIIPDTTVWNDQEFIPDLDKSYLRHPLYLQYPVVGINLNQANIFTNWRNDRVAELILYSLNIISFDPSPTPENHFTIERYLNKEFHLTLKYEDISLPIYKIPSKTEWEFLAKGNSNLENGTDPLSRWNKKTLKRKGNLFCTKEYVDSQKNKFENGFWTLTSFKFEFSENIFGLHGVIGNVAELVSSKGISKGGSWKHSINEIRIENDNIFEKPNCWTGFRNICEWKSLKIKNEVTNSNKKDHQNIEPVKLDFEILTNEISLNEVKKIDDFRKKLNTYSNLKVLATLKQINQTTKNLEFNNFITYENFEITNVKKENKNNLINFYDYTILIDPETYELNGIKNDYSIDSINLVNDFNFYLSNSDTLLIRIKKQYFEKEVFSNWDTLIIK